MSAGLILASNSPRRRELLSLAGLSFTVIAPEVDEICEGSAEQRVQTLSLRKASAVFARQPDDYVIGADTLVELPGEILEKPVDEQEARRMLQSLSGRWHDVYTGITLLGPDINMTIAEHSRVLFAKMSRHEIDWYIATGEPMDKAGAYGIQGAACRFITRVEGCYFNIVGLPVARLFAMLRECGVKICDNGYTR